MHLRFQSQLCTCRYICLRRTFHPRCVWRLECRWHRQEEAEPGGIVRAVARQPLLARLDLLAPTSGPTHAGAPQSQGVSPNTGHHPQSSHEVTTHDHHIKSPPMVITPGHYPWSSHRLTTHGHHTRSLPMVITPAHHPRSSHQATKCES